MIKDLELTSTIFVVFDLETTGLSDSLGPNLDVMVPNKWFYHR